MFNVFCFLLSILVIVYIIYGLLYIVEFNKLKKDKVKFKQDIENRLTTIERDIYSINDTVFPKIDSINKRIKNINISLIDIHKKIRADE